MASPASAAQPLAGLPPIAGVSAAEVAAAAASARRLVVLDDDPTGTQTVSDIPIVTSWEAEDLRWGLRQEALGFYVLTNTRSLPPAAAARRNAEVAAALASVAREEQVDVAIVSRSDSTLRGHFPLETDVLAAAQGGVDGVVIAPAYIDAGRVTVDSVHWVRTASGFVRAGESEFASDQAFGYRSSDLRDWVAEKTAGRWPASEVARVTIDDIRSGGVARVAATLGQLRGGRPVVVDAASDVDLRVVALAAIAAERDGTTLLYRVGPSFVRNRLGQEARPPLEWDKLAALTRRAGSAGGGGLVVVGSYVGLTSRQLERLLASRQLPTVVLDVSDLLAAEDPSELVAAAAAAAAAGLEHGDVIVSTSRQLRAAADADASLSVGARVSDALVEIVRAVTARQMPRWIVAKGGITSSDVATRALGIRRAWARGTLLPGIVSVWEPVGGSGEIPPYVVFAGNVGDEDALRNVVARLNGAG